MDKKKKIINKRSPVKKRKAATQITLPSADNSFYVVGIGASAGGLDALERFFKNMPEQSGIAFIVVSHLDPNHISIMPELIQKVTKMKIFQAEDGMKVLPNNVYVAPSNRDLAILHGTIQLIEPPEVHGFRLPIDYFFKSLSEDLGEKAICIILSGMASDGTAGLRAVKSELGMVMAQDPESAKFDGMPSSAIKTGLVDYILPPEEMPAHLINFTKQKVKGVLLDTALTDGKIPDAFQKIFILLRTRTGHDFSLYKQNTLFRRVERRMSIAQLDNLPNYIRMLQENPEEIESLFKELLIGVTNFFRDPEAFEKLKELFNDIVKTKPENSRIRIWVPGCSTGEEAYSIAIVLKECMNEAKKNFNVQIFATDIDKSAIDFARIGTYLGIKPDVSKERLKSFFNSTGNQFHIRKEIREMLVFAPQSVIKDPPFTKLDLISCRNLLIYFNSELQKKIIPLFNYSLVTNGILFLGSSETISGFVDLFSIIDKKWKFYRSRESIYSAQTFIEFPVARATEKTYEIDMKQNEIKNIPQLAAKIILQSYKPNCVIISESGDILYIHGKTGKYLELSDGEAKMNIFEMAREGLQQELTALIRKVKSGKKALSIEGVRVKLNGKYQLINVTVKPINEPALMNGSTLIIFEDVAAPKKSIPLKKVHYDKKSEKVIRSLEHELKSVKENLRTTVEELETSNEELKSTNEEMQSTNEEMQSSNEELETSKEELQSLNEELITVNTELQNKNDELSSINNDMKNLLDSIDIPTIFLDNKLNIKRFTYHATKIVNLINSDIGRPVNHIATNLKYESLVDDAREVLRTLIIKEVELQTKDNLWFQMRILPYRTISNLIDGVVITFTDITTIKIAYDKITKLNQDIQLARDFSNNIVETLRDSLLILDENLKVLSANRSFYKVFDTISENVVGKFIYELEDNRWDIPELRRLLEEIVPQATFFESFEVEYNFDKGKGKGKGKGKLILNAREIFQGDKESKLILLAIHLQSIEKEK
ncbi:MAG TPA: chemotaxis protein CheB [Ignavibacteriaceae bacterium]|nr:chemotaxis protein CheB [Ignavibacteriaceae bacterium]